MKPFEILTFVTEATNVNPEAGNREIERSAIITLRIDVDEFKLGNGRLMSSLLRAIQEAAKGGRGK